MKVKSQLEDIDERLKAIFSNWKDQPVIGNCTQIDYPDGIEMFAYTANQKRDEVLKKIADGTIQWSDLLMTTVLDAFASQSTDDLSERLVRVTQVATAWIEAIESRTEVEYWDLGDLDAMDTSHLES